MQLGVFSPVLANMSLKDAVAYLKAAGVDCMELGVGGCPGTAHADARELVKSAEKIAEIKKIFDGNGIRICALSVHGNGVHPNKTVANTATEEFEATCAVAEKLGVKKVITFSGCPGDRTSEYPNWVTCAWPTDYTEVLKYQWEEVLIPYWKKEAKVAKDAGVKVCFEMHPGFCVYNPETMLKLRAAVGDTLGANLDPSHLIWQGIDIPTAISELSDALYYFHAKDTFLDKRNVQKNGVLDTKSYADMKNRAWYFRTVGYGNGEDFWRGIVSALRLNGYDDVMSIEHEDALMTPIEGLEKAIAFLKGVMIREENATEAWWI